MFKVVIIDDEPYIRARLRELIDWEELGFTLAGEADNGEDALRLLVAERPDLVITDIRIPVFSGLELIRKTIPELPRCQFILLSGYSDFQYAQEAIRYGVKNYLLKPVSGEELLHSVLAVKDELTRIRESDRIFDKGMLALREKWTADVLHGTNASSLLDRAAEMKLNLEGYRYTVYVVDWKGDGDSSSEEMEDEEMLRDTLFRMAVDETLAFGTPFMVTDEQGRYVVLHMFPAEDRFCFELRELAEKLREKCGEVLDGQVTVGYSESVDSLADVASCCSKANQAVEGKFVLGRNKAIGYEDIVNNGAAVESWNKIAEFERSGLEEAIRSLNLDAVRDETRKMFSILRELSYDPSLIRGIITENLMGVLRILIKINGDVNEALGESFKLDEWLDKHTLDELEEQFYASCVNIVDYVYMAHRNRPGKVVEQMQSYINENYAQEITLKSISRIFYMNPVYLGQVFKNETGIGYHHYLTQVRMKAAKQMLVEKDWGVSEIAEKAGYKVTRNFYIAFKKHVHCTPNEYRSRGQQAISETKS
ncbi:response regulator transcription factor [Gorillibacterium massiliense]|uniref:response regulator transcription factor n=1 Tax=Gorillibacterium massiliense TaxID=1280390 RepID=UPI0004B87E67|nr:response regulator [Gorillibacterium massiliense]